MTNHCVELLRDVCETIGRGRVHSSGHSRTRFEIVLMIYAEDMRVDVIDILANDRFGLVLTHEAVALGGNLLTRRGVHLWTFQNGRCVQFEAYGQGLIVMVPGT